jgi:hypothetical protein
MTGVDIIGGMLRSYEPMAAIVVETSIKAGALPDNIVLPAVLVRSVGGADRQTLKRGNFVRVTERVSAAVRASSYREQVAVMKVMRAACAGITGDFGPAKRVSILTAGTGPDMRGPADSFEQTQDFRVSYDEPA